MATTTRLLRVHGRVQGVGYRWSCVRRARELGLAGWVRNRADGSVEALLQGPPEKVDAMCAWLRDGVPGASVTAMDALDDPPDPQVPDGFEQRPTA